MLPCLFSPRIALSDLAEFLSPSSFRTSRTPLISNHNHHCHCDNVRSLRSKGRTMRAEEKRRCREACVGTHGGVRFFVLSPYIRTALWPNKPSNRSIAPNIPLSSTRLFCRRSSITRSTTNFSAYKLFKCRVIPSSGTTSSSPCQRTIVLLSWASRFSKHISAASGSSQGCRKVRLALWSEETCMTNLGW